ncbi:serine hydrolase domain-containing protein [Nonomuraea roseoviolacea]|uniref:CubicO group peptidase (Beta-lactamase class C family) n=1 Tax=Nonomuraea roseoviolacea subsp. carminata TaxID=160689 RepID=A0ABT1K6E3_9ACTN|nr:serine hydrolase domain-containing protein [Nonomuraea roseoviolacea]MCP2349568.1 CubicO group peptidase (beta-lactamase class C family) [Nonomuraea roseoviolacea subsp. carminata]
MNLQERLDEAAKTHDVPGAAIAVWTGGRLHEAATGVLNRNTGVETTPDSVFQVGSTTKVWTAALIMQLAEEGLLDLDEEVGAYLPGFALSYDTVITVRQLLTHTGGFDGDLFEDTGRGDDCLDRFVAYLHGAGKVHEPGELFSYCNAGYCVLGAIVARLRGTTWEQALREHLLTPLGVTHAAPLAEEAVLFRVAAGHVGPGNDVYTRWQMPRSNAPAGSTLCLAPRELVRFGRMFAAGGLAEDGTRVLSEESVTAMRTPQVAVPGVPGLMAADWGLGFELFTWGAYGHDGGTPGQSTFWRVADDGSFAIAMCLNGGGFVGVLNDLLLPLLREGGLAAPDLPRPPERPRAVDPAPYTGRYEGPQLAYEVSPAGGGVEITLIPGAFEASMGQQRTTARYVHLAGETFIAERPEDGRHDTVTFVVRDGVATHLHNSRAVPRV